MAVTEEVLITGTGEGEAGGGAEELPRAPPPARPPLARPIEGPEGIAALCDQFGAVFSVFVEELDAALAGGAGQKVRSLTALTRAL